MSFGEEITQILVIIVVLLMAFFGLNFWTKRKKATAEIQQQAAENAGLASPGGSAAAGASLDGSAAVGADMGEAMAEKSTSATKSRQAKNMERFDLKGKDAEAAAKVLKRMLKTGDVDDR